MKALDDGNFACGIFVDLQNAFDTVDHSILLRKFCHHGIRGLANRWNSVEEIMSSWNTWISKL